MGMGSASSAYFSHSASICWRMSGPSSSNIFRASEPTYQWITAEEIKNKNGDSVSPYGIYFAMIHYRTFLTLTVAVAQTQQLFKNLLHAWLDKSRGRFKFFNCSY
jgi:hypothetical protein